MSPAQWAEVKLRFHEVLEQPTAFQQEYLSQICSDNTVRAEVARLLVESAQAGDFLSQAAITPFLSPDSAVSLQAGQLNGDNTFDRYVVVSLLGEGGMGRVYRAHDPVLRRDVAVKLLLEEFTGDETAIRRFRSEARALSALNHPNICTVHDIGESLGRTFIVMEFVEGIRLDERIRSGGIPTEEAVRYAIGIASGLAKAHAAGVVHRDLKPGNIMITHDGRSKLLDFGISKLMPEKTPRPVSEGVAVTVEGGIIGSPSYMSPEQVEAKDVDPRSDIFSFGAVLYEMLTGTRAFGRASEMATLLAVLTTDPEPVGKLNAGVPAALEVVVTRCLNKDPAKRYQDATSLQKALELVAADGEPERQISRSDSRLAFTRRHLIAAGFLILLILTASIWLGMRRSAASPPAPGPIAVLPLNAVGNDEEVRAFADGLVETLTSKLSQIEPFSGALTVVPATEVRSRGVTSAEGALRIYGASLVITGSAQRWGNQIQFTMNLVDTASLRQVASKTFRFEAAQPVMLRDEAIDGAVALLAMRLSPEARERISDGETSAPVANSEYLKGIGYLARYDLTGNTDKAIQSLTEATRLDPSYALAFAALGQAHWEKARARSEPREKSLALESLQKAIQLNPRLAEPHVMLGGIYQQNGQIADAIREEQTALEDAPANGQAYRILGDIYTAEGRNKEAEENYTQAVRRQPSDWLARLHLATFYTNHGRSAAAREQFQSALRITPDNEVVHRNLAILEIREGRFREASDGFVKTLRFAKNARTYALLGAAYYYQRRYEEAAEALRSGIQLDPQLYNAWGNLGAVCGHLQGHGQEARDAFAHAMTLAEKALEVSRSDNRTRADLAEYHARLDDKKGALEELGRIPVSARAAIADEIGLVYVITGEFPRAIGTIQQLKPNDPLLIDMRADPDMEALWKEPALRLWR